MIRFFYNYTISIIYDLLKLIFVNFRTFEGVSKIS